MTTATQSGGASNSSWTHSYDSNGNRTGELIDRPATTRYTYAGTDQNQLLTETTDEAGSYGYIYGGADSQGVPIIVGQSTAGAGTSSVISDPVTGQPLNLTTADGETGALRRQRDRQPGRPAHRHPHDRVPGDVLPVWDPERHRRVYE